MFLIEETQLFLGLPISFGTTCLIYPLTIEELSVMGDNKYRFHLNLLTMSEEDILNMYEEKHIKPPEDLSVFDYLISSCAIDVNFLLDMKNAFFTFIREPVQILPEQKTILVGKIEEKRIINKDNFTDFQNILRQQNNIEIPEPVPENENKMQKKFRLRRLALAKAKRKQALKNPEEMITLSSLMAAFIVYGLGSLEELKKYSIYTLNKVLEMARAKEEYEYDTKAILAGADPKKVKPKYWIRNINNIGGK